MYILESLGHIPETSNEAIDMLHRSQSDANIECSLVYPLMLQLSELCLTVCKHLASIISVNC